MSIHPFDCIRLVLVRLVVDGTRHLSLRLGCIIIGPLWSKSTVQDEVLQ
jgi:hypothetical protein